MKEIQYKDFSLATHKKNWRKKRPNVCQFELTFRCDLHCRYCYSDCYNKPEYIRKELTTEQIKYLLDKIRDSGVIWLCFTGGDPLSRPDFLEIYSYAKTKGFIITIFTNGFSMTQKIADYLERFSPFVVEITLNAVAEKIYEEISQVKGSFKRAINGMEMLKQRKIPLKIKTMVIKNNLDQMPKIKEFIEDLGLRFRPSYQIYARLNRDLTPCSLRIKPEEALDLSKSLNLDSMDKRGMEDCLVGDVSSLGLFNPLSRFAQANEQNEHNQQNGNNNLFRCAVGGGDGFHIDPYGKMLFCSTIRRPAIDLLNPVRCTLSNGVNGGSIEQGLYGLFPKMRMREFKTYSRCRSCEIVDLCLRCPGRAYLETGDMEAPIEWFCELAHLVTGHRYQVARIEGRR